MATNAMTAEQQSLTRSINERIAEIQQAVRRALPGNAALHAEFGAGEPAPAGAEETVALARRIEPLAREHRSLLLSRGVDAAKLSHLAQMTATLAASLPAAAAAAAEPASAPEAAAEPAAKKGGKRKNEA